AGEVLVEFLAVVDAKAVLQAPALFADHVENAPPVTEPARLGFDFIGPAFEEQFGEHARRPIVGWDGRSATGPREAEPFARQRQAGIACHSVQALCRKLVERDRIAEACPSLRMRRTGQEAKI